MEQVDGRLLVPLKLALCTQILWEPTESQSETMNMNTACSVGTFVWTRLHVHYSIQQAGRIVDLVHQSK